jgi:hypothetical protein
MEHQRTSLWSIGADDLLVKHATIKPCCVTLVCSMASAVQFATAPLV